MPAPAVGDWSILETPQCQQRGSHGLAGALHASRSEATPVDHRVRDNGRHCVFFRICGRPAAFVRGSPRRRRRPHRPRGRLPPPYGELIVQGSRAVVPCTRTSAPGTRYAPRTSSQLGHKDWLLIDQAEEAGGLACTVTTPEGFLFDMGGESRRLAGDGVSAADGSSSKVVPFLSPAPSQAT